MHLSRHSNKQGSSSSSITLHIFFPGEAQGAEASAPRLEFRLDYEAGEFTLAADVG